jgi:hypothetical protein
MKKTEETGAGAWVALAVMTASVVTLVSSSALAAQPKGPGPDDETPPGKLPGKGPSPSEDDAPVEKPASKTPEKGKVPTPSGDGKQQAPASKTASSAGHYPQMKTGEPKFVPFPFPVITEVLYAVPSGGSGDASGDGERHATGDEFIELANVHDKPIELGGVMLLDKQGYEGLGKKGRRGGGVKFTFPALTLQPGEMVVVFNGFGTSVSGPVGDDKTVAGPNEKFGNSRVFVMNATDERSSLSNSGDVVIVMDSQSKKIMSVIAWGEGGMPSGIPKDSGLGAIEEVPTVSGGSVMRAGASNRWQQHAEEAKSGLSFSPGWYGPGGASGGEKKPVEKTTEKPSEKPAEKTTEKAGGPADKP